MLKGPSLLSKIMRPCFPLLHVYSLFWLLGSSKNKIWVINSLLLHAYCSFAILSSCVLTGDL